MLAEVAIKATVRQIKHSTRELKSLRYAKRCTTLVLSTTYLVCILIYHLTFLDYNRGKLPNIVLYFESLTRPKHHNTYKTAIQEEQFKKYITLQVHTYTINCTISNVSFKNKILLITVRL